MQNTFEAWKEALTTAPVLAFHDHENPFIVATEASSKAIGAVLQQLDVDGREHPLHYASHGLMSREKNYSTYERKAFAITFALKKFPHYLLCQKFKLFTDHEALKYVINMKDPHGRIARWMSTFAEYDFDRAYRPGSKNANADYLSRPTDVESIVLYLSLGSVLDAVKQYLKTGTIEAESPNVRKATKIRSKNYVIYSRNLYRRTPKGSRYIPDEEERLEILTGLHDDIGHWDFTTTYQIFSKRFWWPKMRVDAAHFVKSCDECQNANPSEQNRPHGNLTVSELFYMWSIDFAGPFSETDSDVRYVLLAVKRMHRK